MKTNTAESVEAQGEIHRGIQPHPEFESFSDGRLELHQALIDQKLAWGKEDGDALVINWYECEMALLQTERARRNGSNCFRTELRTKDSLCGINLQSWQEYLSTTPEIRHDTIDNLAPDSGLVAVSGRGKQGKSTLLLHGVRSVANGLPFLNRRTKQKPVVYVNYEMPDAYLRTLLEAAGQPPEKAFILNRPEPVLRLETVENIFKTLPGSVLIIDSFRGAFRLQGESENHAGGAGVILRSLQDLAIKFNGLVFVIHHRNRSAKEGTDGISGTSDWIAAPDAIWSWSRPDAEKPGVLTVEGRLPPIEPLSIQLSPDQCVFIGTAQESQEQADRDVIVGALTAEGQTADAIAEAVKLPGGTVRKRLEGMLEQDQVERTGEGKRGNPFLWTRIDSARNNPLGAESIPEQWEVVE